MKIIKRIWNPVTVDYFGILMPVPSNIKWLATDADGSLYGYENEPTAGYHDESVWRHHEGDVVKLADVDVEGKDWRESLVEVG